MSYSVFDFISCLIYFRFWAVRYIKLAIYLVSFLAHVNLPDSG